MTLKYKVGDHVRIVEGGWGISDSDVESLSGKVFEVTSHLPDGYFGEDGYLLKPSLLTRFDYTPGDDGFIGGEALQLVEEFKPTGTRGTAMGLKYKIGDVVVLDENVDTHKGFTPGVAVRIGELCSVGTDREHYTIYTLGSKGRVWWVDDSEINHEATEELQESNEIGDIVGKGQAVSDDNAKEVRTPVLEDNAPQTAPQSVVEGSFASVYSSVSVFRKGSVKEGDSVLCSEGSTTISIIEDGVKFLVFHQDGREIYLDFEEVDAVFSAAKKLMLQYNNGL